MPTTRSPIKGAVSRKRAPRPRKIPNALHNVSSARLQPISRTQHAESMFYGLNSRPQNGDSTGTAACAMLNRPYFIGFQKTSARAKD
jgi:hypothetical protein